MSIITCLKELEEKGKLEHNDIVEFNVKEEILEYRVQNNFLIYKSYKNDKIFDILEIDKIDVAKKTYGYEIENEFSRKNSYWPYSKSSDYSALTRLVIELYKIIEKQETGFTKFTRFEIMDI